jgi:hypothetical protein
MHTMTKMKTKSKSNQGLSKNIGRPSGVKRAKRMWWTVEEKRRRNRAR